MSATFSTAMSELGYSVSYKYLVHEKVILSQKLCNMKMWLLYTAFLGSAPSMLMKEVLFLRAFVHLPVCLSSQKLKNYWSEIDVTW